MSGSWGNMKKIQLEYFMANGPSQFSSSRTGLLKPGGIQLTVHIQLHEICSQLNFTHGTFEKIQLKYENGWMIL